MCTHIFTVFFFDFIYFARSFCDSMQDLIFIPFEVCCPKCSARVTVSLEALNDNETVNCLECNFSFEPNINTDLLLKLMKKIEKDTLSE